MDINMESKHKTNNPSFSDNLEPTAGFESRKENKKVTNLNFSEEKKLANSEEEINLNYVDLAEALEKADEPITETSLLKSQYNRLCTALCMENDSVIISGNPGEGKTTLVKYFANCMAKQNTIAFLKGTRVFEVSSYSFPTDVSLVMDELENLAEKIKKEGCEKVVLFFDNFEKFPSDFWNIYSEVLTMISAGNDESKFFKFIVVADSECFEESAELINGIISSSVCINVKQEVLYNKVLETVKPKIFKLAKAHGITDFSKKALNYLFDMGTVGISEDYLNYKSFLIGIDRVFSWCEINGTSVVTLEETIRYEQEKNCMEDFFEKTIEEIKSTAFHEAGHVLIAMLLSEFIYFRGVSIALLSQDVQNGIDGITLTKMNEDSNWLNRENLIKYIAWFLGGRYCEKNFNVGASSDLENATKFLKNFLLTSGCSSRLGNDFYCDENDWKLLPESKRMAVIEECMEILDQARLFTKNAIYANQKFIEEISSKLLIDKYLTRDEVLEIWEKYGVSIFDLGDV